MAQCGTVLGSCAFLSGIVRRVHFASQNRGILGCPAVTWSPRGSILVTSGPSPQEFPLGLGPGSIFCYFLVPFGAPRGTLFGRFSAVLVILGGKSCDLAADPFFYGLGGGKATSAEWLYVVET